MAMARTAARTLRACVPRPAARAPLRRHAARATANAQATPYAKLAECEVIRATDQKEVRLTDEWSAGERAVVVFGRSFG